LIIVMLLVVMVPMVFAWEEDMLNLKVPTNLKAGSIVVDIEHRLLSGFNGANFDLGLRGVIWSKLELNSSYAKYMYNPRDEIKNEFTIGASYAYFFPKILRGQVDIQFFSYEKELTNTRKQNLFYQLALQSEPILKTLIPVVNFAYDGDNKRFGFGAGLDAGFNISFGPIQRFSLIGEYFPVFNRYHTMLGDKNSFATGIVFGSYGHHFMFMLGNNLEMGSRRLMLGAPKNTLYFGLNIQRHLDLKTL
jgi:hypothetical protein